MNNHLSLMGLKEQVNELLEAAYDRGRQEERLDRNEENKIINEQINELKELSRDIGREEAWACAKKLVVLPQMGGLSREAKKEIFGVLDFAPDHVLLNYSACEAIEKIKEWEENKDTDGQRHCKDCGYKFDNYIPNYCPNCGAKMEVEQ